MNNPIYYENAIQANQYQNGGGNIITNQSYGSSSVDHSLTLKPSCLQTMFMLPFPFFCIGCCSCINITARLRFDASSRIITVKVCPGFLLCCSKQYHLQLTDIQGLTQRVVPNCKVNKQPAYQLRMNTTEASIVLTGAKTSSETHAERLKVEQFLRKCHG